jgi:hypothetical protein
MAASCRHNRRRYKVGSKTYFRCNNFYEWGLSTSTKQFVVRVPQLAKEVGIIISEDEARDMYDLRSTLVHGQNPGSSKVILTLSGYALD